MSRIVKVQNRVASKTAIQWTEESVVETLKFLEDNDVGYTFHEINSGGQLVIYTGVGPIQIPFGHWIIFDHLNQVGNCESNETFTRSYEILEETKDDDSTG